MMGVKEAEKFESRHPSFLRSFRIRILSTSFSLPSLTFVVLFTRQDCVQGLCPDFRSSAGLFFEYPVILSCKSRLYFNCSDDKKDIEVEVGGARSFTYIKRRTRY